VAATNVPQSNVLDFLRQSATLRIWKSRISPIMGSFDRGFARAFAPANLPTNSRKKSHLGKWINWIFVSGFALIVLWGTWEAVLLLRLLNLSYWQKVMTGAFFTALRVICALFLSLLWTVPVGVAIGRNPRLAQILQPLVQIATSVPATALFPVLLLALIPTGGGLEIGSVALMMLGTMWYLLFNVIADAQSIPSELFEAAQVYKFPLFQRWETLILSKIFAYLITVILTTVGGAWNASIVS